VKQEEEKQRRAWRERGKSRGRREEGEEKEGNKFFLNVLRIKVYHGPRDFEMHFIVPP